MSKKVGVCLGVVALALMVPLLTVFKMHQVPPRVLSWIPPEGASYPAMMTMGFASPDHIISVYSDEQVREWDLASPSAVKTLPLSPFLRAGSFAQLPVLSRDGKWGAAQGIEEQSSEIFQWDGKSLHHTGTELGADHTNQVVVWDMKTGRQVATLTLHSRLTFFGMDFSGDGSQLVIGGETADSAGDPTHKKLAPKTPRGAVEVWNWRTGRLVWSRMMNSPVNSVSWANNGNVAIAGGGYVSTGVPGTPNSAAVDGGGEVEIWNPARKQRVMQHALPSVAQAVVLSADGKWITVAQSFKGVQVFDAQTGALHLTLQAPMTGRHGGTFSGSPRLETLAVSSDSRFVAGSSERGRRGVLVWKLADGHFVGSFNTTLWKGRQSEPTDDAFALSPDGKSLAVGSSSSQEIAVYALPQD